MESIGLDNAWNEIEELNNWRHKTGVCSENRKHQSLKWFNSEVKNRIIGRIEADAEITKLTTELGDAVFTGEITPERAVDTVLSIIIKNKL